MTGEKSTYVFVFNGMADWESDVNPAAVNRHLRALRPKQFKPGKTSS